MSAGPDVLEFVVGAERRLADVLSGNEVLPLLSSSVQAGIRQAALAGQDNVVLWSWPLPTAGGRGGEWLRPGPGTVALPILLEGEPAGNLWLIAADHGADLLPVIGKVVAGALNSMVQANLKRMLTTEIHTRVVNQSYDELLESNRRLSLSERNYRELASSLEKRVQERTLELKQAYARLVHQEKLAAIGQLAAGMAHEINNPLGFVLSNLQSLEKYVGQYTTMLNFYRQALDGLETAAELRRNAAAEWRRLKLDFIGEDLADLFQQSLAGAERIRKIVADLRGFSHVDELGDGKVDLNLEIGRCLAILTSEFPGDMELQQELGLLPEVPGTAAALGQVFCNVVRNALQSRPEGLKLLVRSSKVGGRARIEIVDNGPGIPEAIRQRVFEPFFTTREVGQGAGLGLTVAYDVIHDHGGSIEVLSPAGGGTAIIIELPTQGEVP